MTAGETRTQQARGGEVREQLDSLVPDLYGELRRIAERTMRRERQGHTLQPTALVSEAYMRLAEQRRSEWRSRSHLLSAAAQVMRRVLVDHARSRLAAKRGGTSEELPLEEQLVAGDQGADPQLLALDQALDRLAGFDPQMVRVVELRHFAGLTLEETAEVLGVSTATVKRDWAMARAWLYRELSRGAAAGGDDGEGGRDGGE
ncbi:MAG TPA: sigma-70 family RNA polymerase sigma factor [Thermoanaerobaculia bacterium]|nr:sigma-70 family RNA polymerase sigma factor [Thermoanaerobaculia bacterium]